MDNKVKNTHGGARAGAGRKKKEVKAEPISKVVYFRLENSLYKKLEDKAKENNKNLSEYVRDIVIKNIENK